MKCSPILDGTGVPVLREEPVDPVPRKISYESRLVVSSGALLNTVSGRLPIQELTLWLAVVDPPSTRAAVGLPSLRTVLEPPLGLL